MKVSYNISNKKKVNFFNTLRYSLVLLLFAALFGYLGIRTISVKDQQLKKDIKKLSFYNTQLEEMSENTYLYNNEIRSVQKKWKNKVRYSNLLISGKRFDVIGQLEIIEKMLPVGVYIKAISMRIGSRPKISITVVANSYHNLFQVYKKFSPFDPSITSESETDGIYQARINLFLKNISENKEKKENETK